MVTAAAVNENQLEVMVNNMDKGTNSKTVSFTTTRFGGLEVASEKVISFPNGLPGFPSAKRFVVLDYENEDVPFKWLQSVDMSEVAFLVVNPIFIKSDYLIEITKEKIADLGDGKAEDFAIFAIMTIPEGNTGGMTANFKAPLLINSIEMRGKQLLLEGDKFPLRYKVFH